MPVKTTAGKRPTEITDRNIQDICERLTANKPVRRRLPVWGRVHVDRALPFLCVYRKPRVSNDEGTDRLVTTEAAYVRATGLAKHQKGISKLVGSIAKTIGEQFGTFLVLEIWAAHTEPAVLAVTDSEAAAETSQTAASSGTNIVPGFRIFLPPDKKFDTLADSLESALQRVRLMRRRAEVTVVRSRRPHPPRMSPIIGAGSENEGHCIVAGIEVRPVYRDPAGEQLYPLRMRPFRRQLQSGAQAFLIRIFTEVHHPSAKALPHARQTRRGQGCLGSG